MSLAFPQSVYELQHGGIEGDCGGMSDMNIGVIGYYGFGNVGDEVILENLRSFLAPHRLIPVSGGFPATEDAVRRLNHFDFVILGGGGLYGQTPPSPFGEFDQWWHCLEVPIGVLGLGVERLDRRYQPATDMLAQRSRFFVVRDEESKKHLNHPSVRVAPDLTFYQPIRTKPYRGLGPIVTCGVNLRPTKPEVDEWVQAVNSLPGVKQGIPFSVHPAFGDHQALLAVDPNCAAEYDHTLYSSIDILVGTAFHSVVFAIQSSIPVIAINYHPKVRRIMEEVGLSEYILEWNEWDKLPDRYSNILAHYESIQARMRDYSGRAHNQLLQELESVKAEINRRYGHVGAPVQAERDRYKVSIVVDARNSTLGDLQITISSCANQIDTLCDLIIITDDEARATIQWALADMNDVRHVNVLSDASDWELASTTLLKTRFLTWIRAGMRYAEDAIATLVATLDRHGDIDVVCADYYTTYGGIILRRADAASTGRIRGYRTYGPCFLARCHQLRGHTALVRSIAEGNVNHFWSKDLAALHVPHALLYAPASDFEVELYQSAAAYGHGRVVDSRQRLFRILNLCKADTIRQAEAIDVLETVVRDPFVHTDPFACVEDMFQDVPDSARDLLKLKQHLLSRLAMALFFQAYEQQTWGRALQAGWQGVIKDWRWLGNTGVQVIALKTLVKMLTHPKGSSTNPRA